MTPTETYTAIAGIITQSRDDMLTLFRECIPAVLSVFVVMIAISIFINLFKSWRSGNG